VISLFACLSQNSRAGHLKVETQGLVIVSLLTHLQKTVRDRAQTRIDKSFDNLGVDSTVDIRGVYL
jgi:hypothetical protein